MLVAKIPSIFSNQSFNAKGPLARVPAPGAMTMIRLREVARCFKDLGSTRATENQFLGAEVGAYNAASKGEKNSDLSSLVGAIYRGYKLL